MFKKIIIPFLLLFIIIVACKDKTKNPAAPKAKEAWSELPKVISLDSLKQTDFVATLENPIDLKRNTVYAAALLYAWDTVQKLLGGEIANDSSYSNDFNLLRQSTSFLNSLSKGEYEIKAAVDGKAIFAEAFFNKTLAFPSKMEKATAPMLFEGQKVNAFGMYGINQDIAAYSQVLFYQDDDRFLLKLLPKEVNHEIWLMKAQDTDSTLAEVVKRAKAWKAAGESEATNEKLAWKYNLTGDDVFSIPEIKYNIETHYKTLEGQVFFMKGEDRRIRTAYQRTGFILNETGAVAESHAVVATDTAALAPDMEEIPKPKKMIFDKAFYIILKRTDSENPYFVMRVANAELLVKQ